MDLEELRRNWNAMGEQDPLWAVLSDPSKRGGRWDPEEFYATGHSHVNSLMNRLLALGVAPAKDSALDFGCGVGRLTFPLSEQFRTCFGVDIAPSMIDFANNIRSGRNNCTFLIGPDDGLPFFEDSCLDLVVSYIVLQHMPPQLSKGYLSEFARILKPSGVLVFQIPAQTEQLSADNALPTEAFRAQIDILDAPREIAPGTICPVSVRLVNQSGLPWPLTEENEIRVGNHWLDETGNMIRLDDGRTSLPKALGDGDEVHLRVHCTTPSLPGTYFLEIDLVQEGVAWFANRGSQAGRVAVEVKSGFDQTSDPQDLKATLLPPRMEMFCIPITEVVDVLERNHFVIESIEHDFAAGPGWRSYEYIATRR